MIKLRPIYSNDGGDRWDGVYSFPPKNPQFEALDLAEVEQRIRQAVPKLGEDLYPLLARAVIAIVPAPPEMADCLGQTIFQLDRVRRFLQRSMATTEKSFESLAELCSQVLDTIELFQVLRDRSLRACAHKDVENVREELWFCKECRESFSLPPGQSRPPRLLTIRALMPEERRNSTRVAGLEFFVYFITELVRKHTTMKKGDALSIAGKLLAMFWSGKDDLEKDTLQLGEAHKNGRRSARANHCATVEDFLSCPPAPADGPEMRMRIEKARAGREVRLQAPDVAPDDPMASQVRLLAEISEPLPMAGSFEDLLVWVPVRRKVPPLPER
jgi:hypothetical protein